MKMKLALLSNAYPPQVKRGIGVVTHMLASGLRERNHDVTVFTVKLLAAASRASIGKLEEQVEGVRVVRVELTPARWMRWRPGCYWTRWMMRRILADYHARFGFDVIECMDAEGWLPWGVAGGVPLAVRCHGAIYYFDESMGLNTGDRLVAAFERSTISRAQVVVGVSRFILEAQIGLLKRKWSGWSETIHNAVDINLFSPSEVASPRSASERAVVFVGALHERKGVFVLADAAARILRTFEDVVFRVYGPDYHRPVHGQSTAERILSRLPVDLHHRFEVVPPVERTEGGLVRVLRDAAVCCFPSQREPFGLTVVEAMACGRPVVFGDEGAARELIEDGVSGLLCDPRSPEAVADRIRLVLADGCRAERMGMDARHRVCELFSPDRLVDRSLDLYRRMIRASGRPLVQ